MSIIEINPSSTTSVEHSFFSAEREQKQILAEYNYPRNKVRVEVVGPHDSRIPAAHEIEVAAMAELGDDPDEVRAEFEPHMDSSLYFLAFDLESEGSAEQIQGMGRIIPSSERSGNKSLQDLASIPDWDAGGIPTYPDPITGRMKHDASDLYEAFKSVSGCESLDTVWDIATVGFDVELGKVRRVKLADSIISSFTAEAIKLWEKGELTHVTSFNQIDAHQLFLALGYPYNDFLGIEAIQYDSFGTEDGMIARPGWLSMDDLVEKMRAQPTRHLGNIALGHFAAPETT